MAWLLILGGAMLMLGLVLLASGKPSIPPPMPRRRRDPGGSGVWIDDHGPSGGLQLDRFGYPVDSAGLIGADDFDSDFAPGGGSGGGGGASGGWDDGGSDGGGGND